MCSLLFLVLGTEQEWKVAERTMETASSGLSSATNELSVASLRAKSASGDAYFSTYTNRYIFHFILVNIY